MDMMGIISVCQWCSKRLLKGLFFATLPNMVSSVLCLNLMMMMMTKTRRQTSALMASFALCLRRRWPRWTRSWVTSLRWSYPTKMDVFGKVPNGLWQIQICTNTNIWRGIEEASMRILRKTGKKHIEIYKCRKRGERKRQWESLVRSQASSTVRNSENWSVRKTGDR